VIRVDSESLTEIACTKIKDMLFQQKYAPGRKLIYRELAKMLRMSSTPVQLALGRLEQEGFVVREPNVGYYVKRIDIKESDDLFDMRRVLEEYSVGMAIKNQTLQDVEYLNELAQNHKNYVITRYDRKKLLLDAKFHWQIVTMSNNWEILKQLRRIYELSYLRSPVDLLPPTRLLVAASEHEEILHWIKERNIPRAQRCLGKHIQEAKEAKSTALNAFLHDKGYESISGSIKP
jgi:DNA-binding GntR family transcriptional regulator